MEFSTYPASLDRFARFAVTDVVANLEHPRRQAANAQLALPVWGVNACTDKDRTSNIHDKIINDLTYDFNDFFIS